MTVIHIGSKPPPPPPWNRMDSRVLQCAYSFCDLKTISVIARVSKQWKAVGISEKNRRYSALEKQYPNMQPHEIFFQVHLTVDVAMLIIQRPNLQPNALVKDTTMQTQSCMLDYIASHRRNELPLLLAKELLKKGANPNGNPQATMRPLHHACNRANSALATLLVESGASFAVADSTGSDPLTYLNSSFSDIITTPSKTERDQILDLYMAQQNDCKCCCTIS